MINPFTPAQTDSQPAWQRGFAYTFGTKTRPRQSSKRECRVKAVRIGVELQRGAVVDTESHSFDTLDDAPVAASMTPSWSSESHLIQIGSVAVERSRARATAPSDRSIRPAVTSSQEVDRFPGTGATRSGSLRLGATALRSTTFTSRGRTACRYSFDHCSCSQIVRRANAVVKQSVHSCQSSLHIDHRVLLQEISKESLKTSHP